MGSQATEDSDTAPLLNEKKLKWYQTAWAFVKPPPCPWTVSAYIRLLVVCIFLAGIILGVIFHTKVGEFLGAGGTLARFVERVGIWGPIVYAAVYVVCTVVGIPGSALTLAAGIVFPQLWLAFITISIGSTVGAILAFILGKTVMRSWVQGKAQQYPIFQAVDHAIGKKGIYMVFLLRLSPVIPFNLLNYALALTAVNLPSYAIASWIGMAPGTFLYIYIPWASYHAATSTGKANLIKDILVYGVGTVVTIAVVVCVTIWARRAIKQAMAEVEAEKDQEQGIINNTHEESPVVVQNQQ